MFSINYFSLWVVIAFLSLVTVGLINELQRLRDVDRFGNSHASGLSIGKLAPQFVGTDLWSGEQFGNDELMGHETLMVFVSTACPLCRDFPGWLSNVSLENDSPRLLIVCRGKKNDCSFLFDSARKMSKLVVDEEGQIAKLFAINRFPTTTLLDSTSLVQAVGTLTSAHDLHQLITRRSQSRIASTKDYMKVSTLDREGI